MHIYIYMIYAKIKIYKMYIYLQKKYKNGIK